MATIEPHPTRQSRRVKKLSLVVLGLLGFVIALVAIGPLFVDWKRFAPRITQVVRDATGLELRIDGDVRVALVPALEVSADGIRLLTTAGFESPRLASIRRVHGRMRLWPLLLGRVDVEGIRIERSELALEVNASGQANWKARVVVPSSATETTSENAGALKRTGEGAAGYWGLQWLRDLRLGELRLTDGVLSFYDARSGQRVVASEWEMVSSPAGLRDSFEVDAGMRINDERVAIKAGVEPLRAMLEHRYPDRLQLLVRSRPIEARFDTTRRPPSLIALDHVASIDVPSLGALAAWLELPLDTDPGPIAVRARIKSNGVKAVQAELSVEGDDLDARSRVDIELDGNTLALVAKLEGGFLDLDRYVPPALTAKWTGNEGPPLMDLFSAASETPLDLDTLRRLTAELDIDVAGLGLAGYAVAPIRFQARAKDGQVDAELADAGFYDGAFSGALRLVAGTETLAVEASVVASNVNARAVAAVLAPGAPPVTGTASGRLELEAEGRTLRELTADAVGMLRADLVSHDGVGRVGQLSQLSLTLQRPAGADARLSVLGDAVYGGESIVFDVTTDPLHAMLAGAPVAVEAEIASELVEASYEGRVLQLPVLSLDGEFDARVRSVARFARWLGRPLASHQTDPGPIQAHALFRSNGRSGTVDQAALRGEGLSILARADFESIGGQVRFNLAAESGLLDLDRFLPGPAATVSETGDTPLMVFSDEPIDASWLRHYVGRFDLELEGVRVSGVQSGVVVAGALDNGVLEVRLDELVLPELTVSAVLRADGSEEQLQA